MIHSVATTLSIIEQLAQAPGPVGLRELSRRIGIPKPRIHRHLRTLVQLGYATQEPRGDRYCLTLKLSHLGRALAEQSDLHVVARSVMAALRERAGQSVMIGQIEDDGVRVIDILRNGSNVEISSRPGTLFDFHCTAQGKVALAFGAPRLWKRMESAPLRQWTDATITDIDRLRAEIDRVRHVGWAVAPGEILDGINALAAPIFDGGGALAGTIGVLGSIQFVAHHPDAELVAAVVDAARDVSCRLGFREAAP
jgi:DNA-binding IclR family transcriptional regulator